MSITDTPAPTPSYPALAPFVARCALHALLAQELLSQATEALGEHTFSVDLEDGMLSFIPTSPLIQPLVFGAHVIASLAPGPRSILWGWAHPRGDAVSAVLKERGEADGVGELANAELPFPESFPSEDEDEDEIVDEDEILDEDEIEDDDGYEDWDDGDAFLEAESKALAALAHEIATAAVGITGKAPYYSATGGRSRMVLLLDAEEGIGRITLADAVAKLPRLLSGGQITDGRAAVEGLAEALGWEVGPGQGQTAGRLSLSDGASTAEVAFDERGRITRVTGTVKGSE